MTTGGALCGYNSSTDSANQGGEGMRGEAGSLHERLVAYVHTLAHGSRRGVWGEHSYARSRIGGARDTSGGRVRVLLAPRPASPPPARLDVVAAPSPPPSPPAADPADPAPSDDDPDPADDEDWEARVLALAPTAAHARLADQAIDALRALRLERLASTARGARCEQARAAARRLRRALAAAWGAGAGRSAAPAWLHAALVASLPRGARRLYEETTAELRAAAPHLAERLTGLASGPGAAEVRGAGGAVGPESSPWLVWVSSGRAELDARWERRLAALVHTRVLRPDAARGGVGPAGAPPDVWCAAAAGAVRAALTDALVDAGERSVVLGGVGCGAALAWALARGAGGAGGAGGVRGAVLCAPPLLTPEGGADDALAAVRLPLLVLAAAGAAAARAHTERGARRLLEVRGADHELRLPRSLRRRLALPQHALDAALVEEVVRWAVDTADRDEPASPSPPRPPRRHALPAIVHEIDLASEEEEYAHLPTTTAATTTTPTTTTPPPAPAPSPQSRSIEVVEGRVVSRVAGSTPLQLLPPRRAPPLQAADIMQLPIVFADDSPPAEASTGGSPVTVTSGNPRVGGSGGGAPQVKLTRVILAKRGGRVAAAGAGAGAGAGATRVGAEARRLLVRRGLRLVPRPIKP